MYVQLEEIKISRPYDRSRRPEEEDLVGPAYQTKCKLKVHTGTYHTTCSNSTTGITDYNDMI